MTERNVVKLVMLKKLALFCFISFGLSIAQAQIPFDAISVEEVPIPASVQSVIDLQTPGARCYRVYVCMNEPWWELFSVYGFDSPGNYFPGYVTLADPVGTRFYQNFGCGLSSVSLNPALATFFPEMNYDSFVTIKRLNNVDNQTNVAPGWGAAFESSGGNIDLTDIVGGSWYTAIARTVQYYPSPPAPLLDTIPGSWSTNIQNIPESDNRLLIAQFTTNGIFNAQLSFKFRQLRPDYSNVIPTVIQTVANIQFSNVPGQFDLPCAMIFLPVGLLNFDAKPVDDRVALNWSTESERDNDYFTIERSKDGTNWEDVRRVVGAGTSNNTIIYSSIDENPYSGISYYRLRQTDFNGYSEVTEMVAVEFYNKNEISIYPNPNKTGLLKVAGNNSGIAAVKILSSDGKLVSSTQNTDVILQEINLGLRQFEAGMYFLEFIYESGEVVTKKLQIEK